MPRDYAVNLDFWERIQPKIRQWEITRGHPMPAAQYQALVDAELGTAANIAEQKFERGRAISLEEERLDLAKEAEAKASRAATVKGITDIGVTAAMLHQGYKQIGVLEKSAATFDKMIAAKLGKPAVDVAALGTKTAPALELGGQAALAKSAPILQAPPAFETPSMLAAEELAGGAAPVEAATGATFGGAALAGTAGYAAGYLASKAFGANEDISQALQLGGAGAAIGGYIAAGTAVGGPVGALLGAGVGAAVSLFDDSVICTELVRQKEIGPREKLACIVFKRRHIPIEMFLSYVIWAGPHVEAMRKGGWRNRIRLPFARAFVSFMVKTARGKDPTWFERNVFGYAWGRCRFIAKHRLMEVMAHG